MKFKIKNCLDCAYLNSPKRFTPKDFCDFHKDKEDQPPGIIKAIREKKRELWSDRIAFGGFASFCIFLALFLFMASVGISFWIGFFLLVAFGGLGLLVFRILINLDQMTRQSIKQLQKKKNEWEIF